MSDSRDNKDYGDFRAFQDYETSRDDASPTPQSAPTVESTQKTENAPTTESTQTAESAPPADSAQSLFATLFPENADSTPTSQNAPPSAGRDEPDAFAQFFFCLAKYGIILAIISGGSLCRLATEDSDRYDRVDRPAFPRVVDAPPERTERDASSTSENAPPIPNFLDDLHERLEISRRLSAPIVDGKLDVDAIRNPDFGRLLVEKASEAGEWSRAPVPKLRAPQDANWSDDAERPGGTLQTLTLYDGRLSRDVDLRFRWIPGSAADVTHRDANDAVQRQTAVERGFWLLETETTEKIVFRLEANDSRFAPTNERGSILAISGRRARPLLFAFPARVDFEEARRLCERLNSLEGKPDGFAFRLPTEAEWERACRAGTTTAFNVGDRLTFRDAVFAEPDASYRPNGSGNVGLFKPNAWGLYDMHGNLAEWTTAVENAPNTDVSDAEPTFVLRGGSFDSTVDACASSAREVVASRREARKRLDAGFRIALAPVDDSETPETDAENQPVETPQVADAEDETNETPQVAVAENEPTETPESAPVAE